MLTTLTMHQSWGRAGGVGVGVGGVSVNVIGTVDIPAEADDAGPERTARIRFIGRSGVEWER
ncbi:hypothetical protein EHS25_008891 [Saitozyma podzolica]|uniref:Uncharacterized protein n=1 Tax=Saitozyma podzolica TaxID=1890683 RepID=A0A427YN18_9TREE|nr:hypothetical protein EHS25_008891 [Saitozyma podzolica]